MGAAGHRGVAMTAGEVGQIAAGRAEVGFEEVEPGADLQHHRAVHDVLRGGAPMQPAPGLAGALGKLAHQRQDRIADILGVALQAGQIERLGSAGHRLRGLRDLGRGLCRYDPEPGLGACQRRLDLGAPDEERGLAKYRAHRRGAKHVGENRRAEHADRHDAAACAPHPGPLPAGGAREDAPSSVGSGAKSVQPAAVSCSSAGNRAL